MNKQRAILLVFGCLAWNGTAADALPPKTNDVHQRALEVLRQLEGVNSKQIPIPAPPPPRTRRPPTPAEVEQFYLEGKLTAKEYQQYLEDHRLDPAKVPNRAPAAGIARTEANKAADGQGKPIAAAGAPKQPDADTEAIQPDQGNLSELERKMDELLRLKAAREAAAANNAASTNAAGPVAPKTKRDRLDDLLKLYINGKIPEAEYKEQRAKIVAGPE